MSFTGRDRSRLTKASPLAARKRTRSRYPLTFFDFTAEHWEASPHLNVVESRFATVRLRQRVTKGAGSRTKGLLMADKLLAMAQVRWRRFDGAHHLPLVRADSPRETRAADRWRVARTVPSIILSPA